MKTENIKNVAGSKLTLKKVTIVELSQEDLALVTGGVNAESAQFFTTSFISCTGFRCCDGNKTEPTTD